MNGEKLRVSHNPHFHVIVMLAINKTGFGMDTVNISLPMCTF